MPIRQQLPVYSPLTLSAVAGASLGATLRGRGERASLADDLARRFAADHVVLAASGTQSLQLALTQAPSNGRLGPTVALPAYSCYDLVTAAVGAGVRIRFYDVDPTTLTPDLESVRRVLSDGVSLFVAGNLYGFPLPWKELETECRTAGVPLIEDAAQGIGTMTDAGPGGSLGQSTVLSFGRGKGWTGGGGGALLLRDRPSTPPGKEEDVSTASLSSSDHATPTLPSPTASARTCLVTTAAWVLGRPPVYGVPASIPALGLGETRYKSPTEVRAISAFSASLALRTTVQSFDAIDGRRRRAEQFRRTVEEVYDDASSVTACRPLGGIPSASMLRLPVLASSAETAARLHAAGKRLGVARGYPTPLPDLDAAKPVTAGGETYPGSRELADRLLTLPTHQWVTDDDVAAIRDLLAQD